METRFFPVLLCLWACAGDPEGPLVTTTTDTDADTDSDTDTDTDSDADTDCVNGWETHGRLLEEEAGLHSLAALTAAPIVASASSSAVRAWDLADPEAPLALPALSAEETLGEGGRWMGLASDGTRWLALGAILDGEVDTSHLLLLTLDQGQWEVASRVELGSEAQRVAADGAEVVVAGPEGVVFFEQQGDELVSQGERSFPEGEWYVTGLALDGEVALIGVGSAEELWLVPRQDSQPLTRLVSLAWPLTPVRVPEGWLVPESSSFWDGCRSALELLDVPGSSLSFLERPPCISSLDGPDGAFDAALFGEELLLANGEAGVLRTSWDPQQLSVPFSTDLTPQSWPSVPWMPVQIEAVEDLAVILGDGTIAVARVCL
jgi:hypothetical protein